MSIYYVVRHPLLQDGVYDCHWSKIKPYFMNDDGKFIHKDWKKYYLKSCKSIDEAWVVAEENNVPQKMVTSFDSIADAPVAVIGHKPDPHFHKPFLKYNLGEGMLVTAKLTDLSKMIKMYSIFDLVLFAVYSPGNTEPSLTKYDVKHVPQLAPSPGLFYSTQQWKKGEYTVDELAELEEIKSQSANALVHDDDWWYLYQSRFNEEMSSRRDLWIAIDRLKVNLHEGKNILLLCFCPDQTRCHTSLIAYNLLKQGYLVSIGLKAFDDYFVKFEEVIDDCKQDDTDDNSYDLFGHDIFGDEY